MLLKHNFCSRRLRFFKIIYSIKLKKKETENIYTDTAVKIREIRLKGNLYNGMKGITEAASM